MFLGEKCLLLSVHIVYIQVFIKVLIIVCGWESVLVCFLIFCWTIHCLIWCNKPYWLVLLSAVEVPTAVLGAEFDQISPPALLKRFEEVLTAKSEVYIRIYINSVLFNNMYNATIFSVIPSISRAHLPFQ